MNIFKEEFKRVKNSEFATSCGITNWITINVSLRIILIYNAALKALRIEMPGLLSERNID